MKHLTNILDKVASELQTRGLTKLAMELDSVSNTLEKTAWDMSEKPTTVSFGPGKEAKLSTFGTRKMFSKDLNEAIEGLSYAIEVFPGIGEELKSLGLLVEGRYGPLFGHIEVKEGSSLDLSTLVKVLRDSEEKGLRRTYAGLPDYMRTRDLRSSDTRSVQETLRGLRTIEQAYVN